MTDKNLKEIKVVLVFHKIGQRAPCLCGAFFFESPVICALLSECTSGRVKIGIGHLIGMASQSPFHLQSETLNRRAAKLIPENSFRGIDAANLQSVKFGPKFASLNFMQKNCDIPAVGDSLPLVKNNSLFKVIEKMPYWYLKNELFEIYFCTIQ
jgi:hypothetical protein